MNSSSKQFSHHALTHNQPSSSTAAHYSTAALSSYTGGNSGSYQREYDMRRCTSVGRERYSSSSGLTAAPVQ